MTDITQTAPIAESDNFIILDTYIKKEQAGSYQSEADLERELIADLVKQGYDYRKDITTPEALLTNLKAQL